MKNLIFVMLGGAVGSGLRYLIWLAMNNRPALAGFPYATLTANVLGCLLIGILGYVFYFTGANQMRDEYRLGIIIGVLGGFTTFSSFGFDTYKLWIEGHEVRAAMNVLISNAAGLIAVVIGYQSAKALWPAT